MYEMVYYVSHMILLTLIVSLIFFVLRVRFHNKYININTIIICCDFQYRDVHRMSSDAEMVRVSTPGGAAISTRIVLTDQMKPTVVSNQHHLIALLI